MTQIDHRRGTVVFAVIAMTVLVSLAPIALTQTHQLWIPSMPASGVARFLGCGDGRPTESDDGPESAGGVLQNPWAGFPGWEHEVPILISAVGESKQAQVTLDPLAAVTGRDPRFVGRWARVGHPTVEWPIFVADPRIPPSTTQCWVTEVRHPPYEVYNELVQKHGFRAFRTTQGAARVAVPVGDGLRVFPAPPSPKEGVELIDYIRHEHFVKKGYAPPNSLHDLVDLFRGRALAPDLPPERVVRPWNRIAPLGRHGALLDMADGTGRHIAIDSAGWRLETGRRPLFEQARSMLPLPEPATGVGGRLALRLLLKYVRIDDPFEALQFGADIVHRLRPNVPQPIGVFDGDPGSTKTSAQRASVEVLDPSTVRDKEIPDDLRDLTAYAASHATLSFDNVSGVRHKVSDRLCQLATGGTLGGRELYSDHGEDVVDGLRKVYLNGISPLPPRADLLDRVLTFHIGTPTADQWKSVTDLAAEWEADHPLILGGLLDLASATFAGLERGGLLPINHRLVDYASTLVAMTAALGLAPSIAVMAYEDMCRSRVAAAAEDEWVATVEIYLREQISFAQANAHRDPGGASRSPLGNKIEFSAAEVSDWILRNRVGLFPPRVTHEKATHTAGYRLSRVVKTLRDRGWAIRVRKDRDKVSHYEAQPPAPPATGTEETSTDQARAAIREILSPEPAGSAGSPNQEPRDGAPGVFPASDRPVAGSAGSIPSLFLGGEKKNVVPRESEDREPAEPAEPAGRGEPGERVPDSGVPLEPAPVDRNHDEGTGL